MIEQSENLNQTEPLNDRDAMVNAAIEELNQQETAPEGETSGEQTATQAFDIESNKALLGFGLGFVEMTVSSVCGVEFELDSDAKTKWIDAAAPMLEKYGPAGLEWFGRYQTEVMFGMASLSLVGGSVVQVRRLKAEKAALEPDTQPEPNLANEVNVDAERENAAT